MKSASKAITCSGLLNSSGTWKKSQILPGLFRPAVLTGNAISHQFIKTPARRWLLPERMFFFLVEKTGRYEIELRYQLPLTKRDGLSVIILPTPYALINQLSFSLTNNDADIFSPQAVSIARNFENGNTTATLVLTPSMGYLGRLETSQSRCENGKARVLRRFRLTLHPFCRRY